MLNFDPDFFFKKKDIPPMYGESLRTPTGIC